MPETAAARALVARLTEDLSADLARTWQRIVDEQAALAARWPTQTSTARQRRLIVLERLVRALMVDARDVLTSQVPTLLADAFEAGRVAALADLTALLGEANLDPQVLLRYAGDDLGNLLEATTHVQDTTKDLVRRLARLHVGDAVLTGVPAEKAGKALAAEIAQNGISAVTYRDGSTRGLGDYADMVLRTRTAEIYQRATFATLAATGVQYVEILDNPSCGLTRHDDPQRANGLVMTLEDAQRYPLSHPRCVRTSIPRVDITSADDARVASPSTTAAQNFDQSGVEQEREGVVARRASRKAAEAGDSAAAARHATLAKRLDAQAARDYQGGLDLRTGAVTSAAEARHVAALRARAGAAQVSAAQVSAAQARFAARAARGLRPGQPD